MPAWPDILRKELFMGVTAAHVIGVVIILFIINIVWKRLARKERPDVYERVQCLECGWTGEVSRYHRVCRKCGGNTLQKISEAEEK